MPQIDRLTLTKSCKEGKVFPVYYLFGDEAHYIHLYAASLVRFLLDRNITDLNYSRYDADELDNDALDIELMSLPPFCPRRVIRLDRAQPALFCAADRHTAAPADTEEKKKGKKLTESWRTRLSELPETSVLLLVDNLSLSDQKALRTDTAHHQLCKAVEAAGGCCVFLGKESESALVDLICRRAAKSTVSFPKELATKFVRSSSDEITQLLCDTDKLIAYTGTGGTITQQAITELTIGTKEEPYYVFADHIASGQTAKGLADLDRLLSYNTPPEMILGTLAKTFCQLYIARTALNSGVAIDRYCTDFSLPAPNPHNSNGYPQLKTFQNAKKYELSVLRQAIVCLFACENKMKSTSLPKDGLLQEAIVRMATGGTA